MTLGLQNVNEVGAAGALALGEMLKVNSSLQTLLLVSVLIYFDLLLTCLCCEWVSNVALTRGLQAGNRLSEAGVLSVAEGLRVNSSLQMLDLVSALMLLCLVMRWSVLFEEVCGVTLGLQNVNEVGAAGALALGEMLKVNSSLQTLLLVSVSIYFDLLLTCLCCEWVSNVALTRGFQAGNHLSEAGVLSLAEGLRVNSSLQMLDLVSALMLLCLVMRWSVLFEEVCGVTLGLQNRNNLTRASICRIISCILPFCNISDILLGGPVDPLKVPVNRASDDDVTSDDDGTSDDDDLDYESDYEVINTFEWQREGLDILPKSLVDDASWSHVLSFLRQVRNILSQ
jgi:hypothetical protein